MGGKGTVGPAFGGSHRAVLDEVSDMVTVSDRAGGIVYANPATERVTGYAPEEFAALGPFSLMHPEDRPRCGEAFGKLAANPGLVLELEHRFRRKDGEWRWAEGAFASRFDDPEVGGLVATVRDVTARKEAEGALRESEDQQAFLLKLGDRLRAEVDARAIAVASLGLLADHMRLDRAYVARVDKGRDLADIGPEHRRPDLAPVGGVLTLSDFPEAFARVEAATLVLADTAADPTLSDGDRRGFAGLRMGALIVASARKGTRNPIWALLVATEEPRRWTAAEVALVEETAERTWAAIERARAEAALRESEEKYRTLVENVGDHAIFLLDADGLVTEWTRGAERVKGYAAEEVVGRHLSQFCTPEQIEAGEPGRELAEAAETGRAEREGWRVIKGGGRIWVNEIATAVRDAEGRLVGFAKIARDLTERMRAGEALRENEERHRLVVEGARDYAIFTTDPEGRIASWSPGAEAVFGWDAEEAVGRTPGFTFTAEDRERGVPEGEFEVARRDGSAPDVRWHARKGGSRAFIEGRTMALRRADGGLRGFLKIGQDVTERRRAEEALRESEERYRLAADAAGIGRWEFAPETGELAGDDAFERHHGAPPGSGLGFEGHLEVIHPDDREEVARRAAEALERRDGYEIEYRVPLPGGPTRFVLSRGRFVGGGDASARLVGVTLDVTGSRELERERERARARELTALAEAAERERISRELHDRVAHVIGIAYQSLELHAALTHTAPDRAAEKLRLARETARLALDQTRALSAELKRLQEEELEGGMPAAFEALAESYVPDAVEVEISCSGDETKIPNAIAVQVYLAMREAVRNAVRHSGCSRIRITLDVRDDEVVGSVEDDGRGFDPEAVGKATPSWGVGLRSMKDRAEMLGGNARVDSGPGTRVEVRVPLSGRRFLSQ